MSHILLILITIVSLLGSTNAETAMLSTKDSSPETGQVIDSQDEQVMSWVEIFGKSIVLHARHSIPTAEITMSVGPVDEGGWRGENDVRAVKLVFRHKGAKLPAAIYLLSPWQKLSWKGTGVGHPEVVTVTKHAVVLGPIEGGDYSKDGKGILGKSLVVVEDMAMKEMCERGTQIGSQPVNSPSAIHPALIKETPIYKFKPYYLWINYPSDYGRIITSTDDASWSAIVQKCMLLVTQERGDPKAPGLVVTYKWFPPARINRTRPRPFDPGEQRLAPDVDMDAEYKKLDLDMRKVFGNAVNWILSSEDSYHEGKRQVMYEAMLPALKEAIFSYPGHTGPAYTAGGAAYDFTKHELKELMLDEVFRSYDKGHWPETLPFFRPELIETLRVMPPATLQGLPELIGEFARLQKNIEGNPEQLEEVFDPVRDRTYSPSSQELQLAEIGDRIRTVIETVSDGKDFKMLRELIADKKPFIYNGFEYSIVDPLGSHVYQSSYPVPISINPALLFTEDMHYRKIANRIIDRIISLKEKYPHFAEVDKSATREEAEDRLWIAFHYTHGMSLVPDPNYRPDKLGGKDKKVFSEADGIDLHMYFFEGPWEGSAFVKRQKIGEMSVVVSLDGGDTDDIKLIRNRIFQFISKEERSRQHGWAAVFWCFF